MWLNFLNRTNHITKNIMFLWIFRFSEKNGQQNRTNMWFNLNLRGYMIFVLSYCLLLLNSSDQSTQQDNQKVTTWNNIKIISSPNTKKLYLFHSPNIMQSHKFIWQGILTFHEMYNLFIILVYTIIVNSEYFINQLIYETTLHLYILST